MAARLTKAEASKIVSTVDTFFFDCDGVLWNSFGLIPGAAEALEKLRAAGKRLFFVTNNSTKSRKELSKSFEKFGIKVEMEEMLGTAYLSAMYLKNKVKLEGKVYMIGSRGMTMEFEEAGIKYIGYGPQPPRNDPTKHYSLNFDLTKDPEVGAVIVGFDEHFNLNKISQAMQYLQDESMPFIATNMDNKYPVGGGVFTPGTGCIIQAVQTAAGRQPTIIGKPYTLMFEIAKSMYDINPERTLMTGDRLDTDILFGKNCGLKTLCVLSGITSEQQINDLVQKSDASLLPDYIADNMLDLCNGFQ